MQPSNLPGIDDPSPTPGLFRVEAETSITKEVRAHFLRGPDGDVLSIHTRLGHAFDALSERGVGQFVLESEGWEVLVNLDEEGTLIRSLGAHADGEGHRAASLPWSEGPNREGGGL